MPHTLLDGQEDRPSGNECAEDTAQYLLGFTRRNVKERRARPYASEAGVFERQCTVVATDKWCFGALTSLPEETRRQVDADHGCLKKG